MKSVTVNDFTNAIIRNRIAFCVGPVSEPFDLFLCLLP